MHVGQRVVDFERLVPRHALLRQTLFLLGVFIVAFGLLLLVGRLFLAKELTFGLQFLQVDNWLFANKVLLFQLALLSF